MAKKSFDFAPLPMINTSSETSVETKVSSLDSERETKVTFSVGETLLDKLKDYGYWEGLTQQDIILQSLDLFFKDKTIRPRPDSVKNKKKVGRKKKIN